MTYTGKDGRQYVVIAAGDSDGRGVKATAAEEAGKKAGQISTAGGTIIAFALPKR